MKKLFTLFTLALLAIPLAWGETVTWSHTFKQNELTKAGGSVTLDGLTWEYTSAGYIGWNSTKGIQIGSSSSQESDWLIQTSGFSGYQIKSIKVNSSIANSGDAILSVKVGSSAFGSSVNLTTTATTYTFSGSASGVVKISLSSNVEKAMYLKSIEVTYEVTTYSVTCNAQPSGGGVVSTSSSNYAVGATVDVTATPNDGYKLSSLIYNDGTDHDITSTKSFIMPANAVTVTGTFTQVSDLYILGMVNGNGEQPNQVVKMNYSNGSYNADIYVIGNYNNDLQANGTWFVFTDVIANDNDGGGWDYVNKNRYQPATTTLLNNGTVSNVPLTHRTELTSTETSFVIPSGLYTVTVSSDLTTFSLTAIKDLKPTITPDGGNVSLNSTATIALSEDFNTFISGCNPVVNSSGATISITPPVATLYVNGTAVNGCTSDYPFTSTGTVILTGKGALVAGNTDYAEKTASATFTVTEPTGTQYKLVENEDELQEGEEYIIAGGSGFVALMGAISSSVGAAVQTGFSYDSSTKILTVEDGCTATPITLGGSTGAWTFNNGSGYIYHSGDKKIAVSSSVTNEAKWVIDVTKLSSSNRLIQNANSTSYYLQYNSSSPRFTDYDSNQSAVALFKKVTASNLSTKPTITPSNPTVKGGLLEGVTITAAEGAAIYYTKNGDDPTTTPSSTVFLYQGPFDLTGSGGEDVTVKAIAVESGNNPSRIATMTYNFQAPSKPTFTPTAAAQTGDFTVTIESSDGGTVYYLLDPETAPNSAQGVIDGNQVYGEAITVTGERAHTIYAAVNLNGITSWDQKTYTITYPTPAITVSPNGGTFTDTQEVTLSASDGTAPYTITYTVNGGESQTYTEPFTVSATSTVVATVVDAKGKTATTTVTFNKLKTTKYVRIKNTADLETDKHYLIVYENGNGAMGTRYNTNYRSLVTSGLTLSDGVAMVEDGCEASIFNLGGNEGAYTFYDGTYYLANTSGTQLNSVTNGTATTSKWSISFSGNNAVITSSTNNSISYTTQYSDFNTGSANNIQLYKEVSVSKPIILPEGKTYLNSQKPLEVAITCDTEDAFIYYTTDGNDPTATSTRYTQAFTISENTTVKAIAVKGEESSDIASETYRFTEVLVNPVVFSPIEGTYSGAQTLQMYSTTQNTKIYYEISENAMPADPTTNSTLYSSSDVINMAVGHTYYVKAVAYVGNSCSEVASGTYTITAASTSNLNSVDEMNKATEGYSKTLGNPVQVVYMNTWRHKDGTNNTTATPEYAYVRDNTGYGLIYFGNGYYNTWSNAVDNPKICQMGDWIPGGVVKGTIQVWEEGFHKEMGGKNNNTTVTGWPTASTTLTNTPIIPEEMTNANINAGWDASKYTTGNYASGVTDNNVWGHYVHMRKNTITNVGGVGGGADDNGKHYGDIVDQSGVPLNYYDGFYNFSGYNGTDDYDADFFNGIQNNGGTFDVYAIVAFYGPYADQEAHHNTPFEVFPIDFLYIYKPIIKIGEASYSDHNPIIVYDAQEVTLTCETEGATIWYKTSDMEDYEKYTPGTVLTIDHTTTIETYSSIPTKYNDVMESVVNTLVINIGSIDTPVISPESQVNTIGSTSIDATVTCATEGVTIYFTIDGSDPKTSTTSYEYTSDNITQYLTGISQTTTVRAIAYKEETEGTTVRGYYSAEAEARTYTFVNSNGVVYDLVTDPTQLNETSVYMVVNKANYMAMSTTQNTANRGATGVQFVDETKAKVYGNSDVALFTLEKVGNQWYLKAMNGSGYLYVGDGNTLLTEAEADGNAEATISIDADSEHQAHISYVYNNETTRYLRYYNGGTAFSTYTSETSNLPVSLYYSEAHTLAWIEKLGTEGTTYTVADDLQVVWVNTEKSVAWARDLVDNINAVKIPTDKIDYMHYAGQQTGEWQQNNWVMLDFSGTTGTEFAKLKDANTKNVIIKGGSLVGNYSDGTNYTIQVSNVTLNVETATQNYTPNVYCAANYGADENGIQQSGVENSGKEYWFMTPKVMEVATHTWSVWNVDPAGFFVPAFNDTDFDQVINGAHLKGGYKADLITYNVVDDFTPSQGQAYEYLGVVMLLPEETSTPASAPRRAASDGHAIEDTNLNGKYKVAALNLTGGDGQIVTAVNHLQASREVVSVTYCDVAGRMSQKPFQGLNIIVTRYTDGTVKTTKAMY